MSSKKDRRDKLIKKGVPASYFEGDKYGSRINGNEYRRIMKKWNKDQEKFQNSLPQELKDNPKFAAATYDEQQFLKQMYDIQVENNEDKARKMDAAFDMAVTQADPYWKQIIRIAQDETVRIFDEAKGDYQASSDRIERRRTELQEDLSKNRDNLSIDEQVELGRLDRSYDRQGKQVAMDAAEAGVTFGTGDLSRAGQQEALDTDETDMVESTKRQYSRQIEQLTIASQRGDTDAADKLAELERTYGNRIQDIGRGIETYLGSDATSELDLEGYQALNDITGTMYEDKTRDIETRKQTLFNDLNQESLDFNFLT